MHVLVIDDETAVRQVLASAVARAGHSVDEAKNTTEAASKLVRGDVDVALCDIKMPDGSGLDLLRNSRAAGIDTTFVMVTAFASLETAVEALRDGAADYIVKPVRSEELQHRLKQIGALRGLRNENRALRRLMQVDATPVYLFHSPSMKETQRLAGKVAPTDSTVLVTGESGTGKSVIVRMIHEQSPRAEGVFLPVNCSAIPENLLESELFGHVKGAFTGADRARKGLFQQSDGGTLFLDEIGELPLHTQAKLLHAIENKQVRAVGSEQSRHVDTRIIVATNRNLQEMVRAGTFREDLYFRLSMFHIHIPPLREREEDIRGLIHFFLMRMRDAGSRAVGMEPEVEDILASYNWPGNVRQLENVLNRACIMADGELITLADLPSEVSSSQVSPARYGTKLAGSGSLRDQLRDIEASLIRQAMDAASGDRRLAAQRLGIGLSSLYRKLEELKVLV